MEVEMRRLRLKLKGVIEPLCSALYQKKWVRELVRDWFGGETYLVDRDGKKDLYTPRLRPTDTRVRTRYKKATGLWEHGYEYRDPNWG